MRKASKVKSNGMHHACVAEDARTEAQSYQFCRLFLQINWIPVIWGLLMQFVLGLLILRWSVGFSACKWLGDQVTTFLGYTDKGSEFVFGEKYTYHPVVFKVMSKIYYFWFQGRPCEIEADCNKHGRFMYKL